MDAYCALFEQQRLMFAIGKRNRERGFRPLGLFEMLRFAWRQTRLIKSYPPSE